MSSEIINDNNKISSNVEGTELLQVDVNNEISKKPVVVTDKKKKRKNNCEEGAVNKLKTNEVKIKIEGEKETSKKGRGSATTWAQTVAILDCLENTQNEVFNQITGKATSKMSTVLAGAKVSAKYGYLAIADYVNEKCGCNWNVEVAKARVKSLVKQFKETKRKFLDSTGEKYCLSEADLRKGLNTLELKLEGYNTFQII